VLALPCVLASAPLDGPGAVQRRIPAAVNNEPSMVELSFKFKGGVRTSVVARGDHKPVVPLDIFIYDANDKVVVKDESPTDFAAVTWTPPRTAEYRIVIRNHGVEYNDVYIFLK